MTLRFLAVQLFATSDRTCPRFPSTWHVLCEWNGSHPPVGV